MIQSLIDSVDPEPRKQSHLVLLWVGTPIILLTGLLACGIVWEETFLSLERGPQMIGFSLVHGPFAIFLLAPLLLMFWLIPATIAIAASFWREKTLSRGFWATVVLALAAIGFLILPPAFWQYVLIERFAKSPHAVEFMTEDAAEGYTRTVGAYLDHGISVDARGRYGTAATAAAVGGRVEVLKLLKSRGANLNATDSAGHSPLSVAIDMKHPEAVSYLKSQGALEIKPTRSIHSDVIVTP
jgi:hypothetical protein